MKFAIGDRVRSSIHGPGKVVNLQRGYVGVNFDGNSRDKMTDCWYRDFGDGQYTAGKGIDVLSFEAQHHTALCPKS